MSTSIKLIALLAPCGLACGPILSFVRSHGTNLLCLLVHFVFDEAESLEERVWVHMDPGVCACACIHRAVQETMGMDCSRRWEPFIGNGEKQKRNE